VNELALFAGAGGGILGAKLLGWRTVCAVEIDPYCRRVLMQRQNDGVLDPFPVWDDVRTFDGTAWRGRVDVVTAGFPCQPFSVAGKQRGAADERNMWPDTARIIREVGPRYCLLENVPALVSCGYVGTVLGDLAACGYDAQWMVLGAADVGAPHLRRRLWIYCDANGDRESALPVDAEASELPGGVADTEGARAGTAKQPGQSYIPIVCGEELADAGCRDGKGSRQRIGIETRSSWWSAEPAVGRVAHGLAHRVDRLRALGNGQVPAVVRRAWELLTGEQS